MEGNGTLGLACGLKCIVSLQPKELEAWEGVHQSWRGHHVGEDGIQYGV